MNEIVVGVKPIKSTGGVALPGEEADAAAQVHWVTVDGQKVPGVITEVQEISDQGFMRVAVEFVASSYRTTHFQGPDAPQERVPLKEAVIIRGDAIVDGPDLAERAGCLVIHLPDGVQIESVDEAGMEAVGWVKKSRLEEAVRAGTEVKAELES